MTGYTLGGLREGQPLYVSFVSSACVGPAPTPAPKPASGCLPGDEFVAPVSVVSWHDPAHVLAGIFAGRQPKPFGAFLTPCGRKRPG